MLDRVGKDLGALMISAFFSGILLASAIELIIVFMAIHMSALIGMAAVFCACFGIMLGYGAYGIGKLIMNQTSNEYIGGYLAADVGGYLSMAATTALFSGIFLIGAIGLIAISMVGYSLSSGLGLAVVICTIYGALLGYGAYFNGRKIMKGMRR